MYNLCNLKFILKCSGKGDPNFPPGSACSSYVRLLQRPQVKLKRSEIRFCDYCNFLPRFAVFTLETDYPSETGYPLDNSPHMIIRPNLKIERS